MQDILLKNVGDNPLAEIKTDGGFVSIFRTIGFIGDSLSSGEHESYNEQTGKGYHDYFEYSWGQFIGRKCGLTAYSFSRGGLTAKTFNDYQNMTQCFRKELACQAYVIALGVNDMSHLDGYKDGFGTISDVDFNDYKNNKDSFVGWYVRIVQEIRELQPKARIFVVTTPTESPETEVKKQRYDMLAEFLRELPKYFEFLYTIDLRKYAPLYDEEFGKVYFCGGHMNAMGYKFTADMISTYMDYIIRKNYEDFTQVGFIGKDVHNETRKW